MNDGARGFVGRQVLMFESGPTLVAAADLDGDRRTDLAVACGNTASRLGVALGRGGGDFPPFSTNAFPTLLEPRALLLADFDQDTKGDLLVAFSGSNYVAEIPISLSRIDAISDPLGMHGPRGLVAADLNGDGCLDLATANAGAASVTVLSCMKASHTFASPIDVGLPAAAVAVAAGRFDIDGSMDLVAALSDGRLVLLYNNGSGSLTAASPIRIGTQTAALATGDIDGDGQSDIVAANAGNGGNEGPGLSVLQSTSAARWQTDFTYPLSGVPTALRIGDLDGDGKADLVVTVQETAGAALVVLYNTTP